MPADNMRKTILLAIVLVVSSGSSGAQDSYAVTT